MHNTSFLINCPNLVQTSQKRYTCTSSEAISCIVIYVAKLCVHDVHQYSMYMFPNRSVEQLDLNRVCWVPVEPMLSRRSTLGVGVLNGELYAVGGFDGNNGLDSVEKYNPGELIK